MTMCKALVPNSYHKQYDEHERNKIITTQTSNLIKVVCILHITVKFILCQYRGVRGPEIFLGSNMVFWPQIFWKEIFSLVHRSVNSQQIIKIAATSCQILRLKCTKFDFGCGSAPDPTGGAYSTPPDL